VLMSKMRCCATGNASKASGGGKQWTKILTFQHAEGVKHGCVDLKYCCECLHVCTQTSCACLAIGLLGSISPMCTLSQNGYGANYVQGGKGRSNPWTYTQKTFWYDMFSVRSPRVLNLMT